MVLCMISKLIEFYSLNVYSLVYFNYTSIKLENFIKIKSKIETNALKKL